MSKLTNLEKEIINSLVDLLNGGTILADSIIYFHNWDEKTVTDLINSVGTLNPWFLKDPGAVDTIKIILTDIVELILKKNYQINDKSKYSKVSHYPELKSVKRLARKVITQLKKIPISYRYYLPLFPSQEAINIKLSKDIKITKTGLQPRAMGFGGYTFLDHYQRLGITKGNTLTLVGTVSGYTSANRQRVTGTTEDIHFKLKVVLGLTYINNLLIPNRLGESTQRLSLKFAKYNGDFRCSLDFEESTSSHVLSSKLNDSLPRGLALMSLPRAEVLESYFKPIKTYLKSYEADTPPENHELRNRIENSVVWFLQATASSSDSRRILSLITSLESLIRIEDSNNTKSKQIREIVSFLLGDSAVTQNDIYKRLAKIYQLRNSLTHNGKAEVGPKNKRERLGREKIYIEASYLENIVKRVILLEFNKFSREVNA